MPPNASMDSSSEAPPTSVGVRHSSFSNGVITGAGDEGGVRTSTVAAKPLAISIDEFCRLTSLGRTTAFELARHGQIEVRHIGRRTLVLMRSVEVLLELHPKDRD